MIAVTIIGMYITGGGNILNGAGMRSFLWGVLSGIAIAFVMILGKKVMTFKEASSALYEGWVGMLPIIIILTFALGLGDLVSTLGTGEYLANAFSGILSPALLPVIAFIIALIISFSTGSSWGTMAVVLPLVMPMAFTMGTSIPLLAGAVWERRPVWRSIIANFRYDCCGMFRNKMWDCRAYQKPAPIHLVCCADISRDVHCCRIYYVKVKRRLCGRRFFA